MIRGRIESDLESLNRLHIEHGWIPNATMIRPSPQMLEEKAHVSENILTSWRGLKDFILHTHFRQAYHISNGKKYINHLNFSNTGDEWNFRGAMFPYTLRARVYHYVLWNALYAYETEFDDYIINEIITNNLKKLLNNGDGFDFVWYKNPKPSIPELWHVQVFWITDLK